MSVLDPTILSRRKALSGPMLLLAGPSLLAEKPSGRFAYKEGSLNSSCSISIINHVPVLKVCGSPEEIGKSTGLLALRQASGILTYPKSLLSLFKLDPLWPILVTLGDRMVERFPEQIHREMSALQSGSNVDRSLLVAGNTMFDLKGMVLCSGMAVPPSMSKTRGSLLARNLDYPPVGDIGQYTLVSIVKQPGLKAFASVGFPGLLGVLSGMNESGLALAIHEIVDVRSPLRKFNPAGLPYALCYRKVLETCSTIPEAIHLLGRLPKASATNLLIADRNNVAVLEITPEQIRVVKDTQGAAICTNHFRHPDLVPENPANPFNSKERLASLERLCFIQKQVGVRELQSALHDTNLGQNTLQSMVFDTFNLVLHLSVGPPPSSRGPYFTVDLAAALRG